MSDYSYTDKDGDRLAINTSIDPENVFVGITEKNGPHTAVHVLRADAPTVAAELLKVAGQEGVFVPKPTVHVEEFPDGDLRCGMTDASREATAGWARSRASELIALAAYIESKAQRETEAAKKLQERRDALTAELDGGADYDEFHPTSPFRRAIDRIIELEDASRD